MKRSALSAFYFVILQVLWIFRTLYDMILPEKKTSDPPTPTQPLTTTSKRHLIHLFTASPKHTNRRPICYVHISQLLTPLEEETLRRACAKGTASSPTPLTLTTACMESFSLVA